MTSFKQYLAEVEERLKKATPGPYKKGLIGALFRYNRKNYFWDDEYDSDEDKKAHTPQEEDAELIAHAPTDLAKLVAMLKVADAALERINFQTGLDDPNFGNFTPLQFAARLGLIDQDYRQARAEMLRVLNE